MDEWQDTASKIQSLTKVFSDAYYYVLFTKFVTSVSIEANKPDGDVNAKEFIRCLDVVSKAAQVIMKP